MHVIAEPTAARRLWLSSGAHSHFEHKGPADLNACRAETCADAVPERSYPDASASLAGFRLPLLQDELRVVVRASIDAGASPLSEDRLAPLRCDATVARALFLDGDAYQMPLEMAGVEAVAIFALLPPPDGPPEALAGPGLLARAAAAGSRMAGAVRNMLRRAALLVPMLRWGPLVPLWAWLWLQHLGTAVARVEQSPLRDASFHNLQALCVAKHLRGQGIGTRVVRLLQEHAAAAGVPGICGLTHSESTAAFYSKVGFAAATLHTSPRYQAPAKGPRPHILVSWRRRRDE